MLKELAEARQEKETRVIELAVERFHGETFGGSRDARTVRARNEDNQP